MFYFKKVILTDYTQNELETALRKVSLKSKSSLDGVGSSTDAGTKYVFLGHEGKGGLTFTRIKYFIEKYLPKLIIKISPDANDCYYKLRFSLVSTIMLMIFSTLAFIILLALVFNPDRIEAVLPMLIFIAGYVLLILLEFKLTTKKIDRTLKSYSETRLA
jgi:hypothetical protein